MQMSKGLPKLVEGIYFSREDWDQITDTVFGPNLPAGVDRERLELTEKQFELVMFEQFQHFLFRKLNEVAAL